MQYCSWAAGMSFGRGLALMVALVLAAGCAPQQNSRVPEIKLGKPYSINGKMYYPKYEPDYDKVGVASWYGPGFHGKYTANGETFDQNDLTAAHPTLPMPSLVRVTNLENGRSLVARVNDRGPFTENRIIDLSKKSAERLGIKGLARVRVQYLRQETDEYVASLRDAWQTERRVVQKASDDEIIAAAYGGGKANQAVPVVAVAQEELSPPPTEPPQVQRGLISSAVAEEMPPQPEGEISDMISASEPEEPVAEAPVTETPPTAAVPQEKAPQEKPAPVASEAKPQQTKAEALSAYAPEAGRSPAAHTGKAYYVQAGAFASEQNARRLAEKLKALGEVSIMPLTTGGQTLQRVRVGPISARTAAETLLPKAERLGAAGARVIRE